MCKICFFFLNTNVVYVIEHPSTTYTWSTYRKKKHIGNKVKKCMQKKDILCKADKYQTKNQFCFFHLAKLLTKKTMDSSAHNI